jgi:hypothetical protein
MQFERCILILLVQRLRRHSGRRISFRSVIFQIIRIAQQYYANSATRLRQMPGRDQPVAAVIA